MVDITVLVWGYLFPAGLIAYLFFGITQAIIQQIKKKQLHIITPPTLSV